MNSSRRLLTTACLALALLLPCASQAGLTLRTLDVPEITTYARFSLDLDTDAFLTSGVSGVVSGYDFFIDTNVGGSPLYGASPGVESFWGVQSGTIALLGEGVTIETGMSGVSFQTAAYFPFSQTAGRYFVAFQTSADLDRNSETDGVHNGFLEVEIGSLTVVGYGFGSVPGESVVTTPIPEPTVGGLALLAALAAVGVRRRRP